MDNLGFGPDLSCTKTDIGPTRVEINLDNIAYNIQQIGRNATPELKVMAVVKADGYGHGAVQVARVAARRGIEWLGVAKLEEGVQLRESGIQSPILILGLSGPPQAQEILKYRLSQTVYTRELARALSAQAERLGQTAKVHVELDTGMGRAGVMPEEATSFFKEISHLQGIKVEGAFTHFSVADKKDKSFTELQIKRFSETIANLEKEGIPIPLKHAANSAATLDIPSSYFDLIRPGIMLYGLYPSPEVSHRPHLKPAMSFKTKVAFLKTVPAHISLSYGRTFTTKKRSRIVTLPIGYADGYTRALSNRAEVLIKGKRAPVVGTICMNMTLVDVTRIPDAEVGDEVVLFGKQDGAEISVDELASKIGTINYEVLCNVGEKGPRVYISEKKA